MEQIMADTAMDTEHQRWVAGRRRLRLNTDNVHGVKSYLLGKPNKSVAERRVLRHLLEEKKEEEEKKVEEEVLSWDKRVLREARRRFVIPQCLRAICQHLQENNQRPRDLFTFADKQKKGWKLNKTELQKALLQLGCHLPKEHLDDLYAFLDIDYKGEIQYHRLLSALKLLKIEERNINKQMAAVTMTVGRATGMQQVDQKRKDLEGTSKSLKARTVPTMNISQFALFDTAQDREDLVCNCCPGQQETPLAVIQLLDSLSTATTGRYTTGSARLRGTADCYSRCHVYHGGTQPNHAITDGEILRVKRQRYRRELSRRQKEKETVVPKSVKSDQQKIQKLVKTRVNGVTSKLRRQAKEQYGRCIQLARERGLTISEKSLKSGLLYPFGLSLPDDTARLPIRQPGTHLYDKEQFGSPSDRKKCRKVDGIYVCRCHGYPERHLTEYFTNEVELISGKTLLVQPKVDCWMTMEEYFHSARNVKKKYPRNCIPAKKGVIWRDYFLQRKRVDVPTNRHSTTNHACLFHRLYSF